jgi:hypothetical protein
MKRPSYREAIAHIALNDNPGDPDALDAEAIEGTISVGLVADLFGVDRSNVARGVVNYRVKREKESKS